MGIRKFLKRIFGPKDRRTIASGDPSKGDWIPQQIANKDLIYFRGYYVWPWLKGNMRKKKCIFKPVASNRVDSNLPSNYVTSIRVIKYDGEYYRDAYVSIYRCFYGKCQNDCNYCERLTQLLNEEIDIWER